MMYKFCSEIKVEEVEVLLLDRTEYALFYDVSREENITPSEFLIALDYYFEIQEDDKKNHNKGILISMPGPIWGCLILANRLKEKDPSWIAIYYSPLDEYITAYTDGYVPIGTTIKTQSHKSPGNIIFNTTELEVITINLNIAGGTEEIKINSCGNFDIQFFLNKLPDKIKNYNNNSGGILFDMQGAIWAFMMLDHFTASSEWAAIRVPQDNCYTVVRSRIPSVISGEQFLLSSSSISINFIDKKNVISDSKKILNPE